MKKYIFFKKTCVALLALVLIGTSFDMSAMTVQAASNSITLSAKTRTINVGKSFKLTVRRVSGIRSKKVTFKSSNTKIATVSANRAGTVGTVKGRAPGTATITATSTANKRVKATCKVTVRQLIKNLKMNRKSATVNVKKTVQLKATVSPSNASNKSLTWTSSNTRVATVNGSGRVTGVATGTATITATAKDGSKKKATCKITVKQPVTSVRMNETRVTLGTSKTIQLEATVAPATASNKALTWTSSNTAIATVSSKGVVKTRQRAGTVTITATAKDGSKKSATCRITVSRNVTLVTSVTLPSSVSINEGNTTTIRATLTPARPTNDSVYWSSSNARVATVDQNGRITAVSAGTATITAKSNDGSNRSDTCRVTVIAPSITVAPASASVIIGDSVTLTPSVRDALGDAVTWSTSNASVATVANGVVTARALGTATITATSRSGKTATSTITVVKRPVASVSIDAALTFTYGVTAPQTLTATVLPTTATYRTVTWSTSNPGVATVNNGVVTATGIGTATITATADGVSATCAVTVNKVPVASVTLDPTEITMKVGDAAQTITATVAPANATYKAVTWTTSDSSVATVDNNGAVTPVAEGTATITATADGVSATCAVTVEPETPAVIPVTAVNITGISEGTKVAQGGYLTGVTATVLPADATDKTITWSTDDENVTVNNGTILVGAAATAGKTVTITATASNGVNTTAVITITGSNNAITSDGSQVSVLLDKNASKMSLTLDNEKTITKDKAYIIEKIDEIKSHLDGLYTGQTPEQLINRAWAKIVTRSSEGITMNVTVIDTNTKLVTVTALGKSRTVTVVRNGATLSISDTARTVLIKDIVITNGPLSDNVDEDTKIVTFAVDVTVNGVKTVNAKEFTLTATVLNDFENPENSLYSGTLSTAGTQIASAAETETDMSIVVDIATVDKVLAEIGSDRTALSLLNRISAFNIYE